MPGQSRDEFGGAPTNSRRVPGPDGVFQGEKSRAATWLSPGSRDHKAPNSGKHLHFQDLKTTCASLASWVKLRKNIGQGHVYLALYGIKPVGLLVRLLTNQGLNERLHPHERARTQQCSDVSQGLRPSRILYSAVLVEP